MGNNKSNYLSGEGKYNYINKNIKKHANSIPRKFVYPSRLEFGDEKGRFNTTNTISHPVLKGENDRKTRENTNELRSNINF